MLPAHQRLYRFVVLMTQAGSGSGRGDPAYSESGRGVLVGKCFINDGEVHAWVGQSH